MIIAADEHDASARLAGVPEGSRKATRNTSEIKTSVCLGVVTGLDELIKDIYVLHGRLDLVHQ